MRVHPAFLYAGHPLSSVSGPFNAVTVESETITEITMSGPGAGGRQTASAVLGDVVSVMTGGARPPAPPLQLRLLEDVPSAFYLHLDVADEPGVLARSRACSASRRSRSARSCSAAPARARAW